MKTDINKIMVFDYFANKLTPLQRKKIENWVQSPQNEELFYLYLEEWENNNSEYEPDGGVALDQFINFLNTEKKEKQFSTFYLAKEKKVKYKLLTPRNIAASLILFVMIGLLVTNELFYFKTYKNTNNEIQSLTLDDGTKVILNQNSSLKIHRWGITKNTREVFLIGEAKFFVTHTKSNERFIVKTDKNFEVVVLGTEFAVSSRTRGAKVILNKGKVLLNYEEDKKTKHLFMKPGDYVLFNKQNKASLDTFSEKQYLSIWQEKKFVFNKTSLKDVATMLEETYGLKVKVFGTELANRKLMGSFQAENLDELLNTISELLRINVIRQNNEVELIEK
jgi:ferric-dicitrate binding protein FerR (iron transport regulator)